MNSSRQTNENCNDGQCQMQEALTFLQRLPLFRETPLDILKLYAYLSKKEEYAKGETIVSQGKPCQKMYLIIKGQVSIDEEHDGRLYTLQYLTDDGLNYFGELALLAQFDWPFSARAESDVTLLTMTREAFRKVMERYPEKYPHAVERIIALRIARTNDQTRQLLMRTDPELWEN